ncbi:hypothetical protein ACFE04_006373 [Oxalis oulophora]
MGCSRSRLSPFSPILFLLCLLLIHPLVKSDDEEDNLYQGINTYRQSLNLTTLTKNENAHCLADELADYMKDQPCTNTTGSNTVPGTEEQISNYPQLLSKCHLNISDTRDGQTLPACVPNLDAHLVLTNFTKSQYSQYLNDSTYTGVGIGSDGNWIVVVLTTSTAEGSYETYNGKDESSTATKDVFICPLLILLLASLFFL